MANSAYPQNQNGWNPMGGQVVQMPQSADQGMNIDIATMIQGGMNTVNSCMVPNGRTAALFDRDEPYFYLKQVNMNGQVVMVKRFKYEEDEPVSDTVTRKEFNELKELILSLRASQTPVSAEKKEGE